MIEQRVSFLRVSKARSDHAVPREPREKPVHAASWASVGILATMVYLGEMGAADYLASEANKAIKVTLSSLSLEYL